MPWVCVPTKCTTRSWPCWFAGSSGAPAALLSAKCWSGTCCQRYCSSTGRAREALGLAVLAGEARGSSGARHLAQPRMWWCSHEGDLLALQHLAQDLVVLLLLLLGRYLQRRSPALTAGQPQQQQQQQQQQAGKLPLPRRFAGGYWVMQLLRWGPFLAGAKALQSWGAGLPHQRSRQRRQRLTQHSCCRCLA